MSHGGETATCVFLALLLLAGCMLIGDTLTSQQPQGERVCESEATSALVSEGAFRAGKQGNVR